MEPDIIRIGSLDVPRAIVDGLLPLLGVVVGGLITYFVTSAAERQKSRQAKQVRLAEKEREALAVALEWLDPMDLAVTKANLLVSGHLAGDIGQEEFMKEWPHLVGELKRHDVPVRLRVLLPDDIYVRGNQIVRELRDARTLGVKFGQEARLRKMPFLGLQQCGATLDSIATEVKRLSEDLVELYRETFK